MSPQQGGDMIKSEAISPARTSAEALESREIDWMFIIVEDTRTSTILHQSLVERKAQPRPGFRNVGNIGYN